MSITEDGAKIADVMVIFLPKGVKNSQEFELSVVNNFSNTPFLLIAMTVLYI